MDDLQQVISDQAVNPVPYLLSGYHVALELLMAFVPSVLACSFTTASVRWKSRVSL